MFALLTLLLPIALAVPEPKDSKGVGPIPEPIGPAPNVVFVVGQSVCAFERSDIDGPRVKN
jgi:hypothetical protein